VPDHLALLRAALVDRYTLERELGRGGMTIIYLAQDLRHKRHAALQVLHPPMPYVEWESLRDRPLLEKQLPLGEVVRITNTTGEQDTAIVFSRIASHQRSTSGRCSW
jgi:serine/threonine protein kinase